MSTIFDEGVPLLAPYPPGLWWKSRAAICFPEGIPLVKREESDAYGFPGGTRSQQDKSPLHTLIREINEEIGVKLLLREIQGREIFRSKIRSSKGTRFDLFVFGIKTEYFYRPSRLADEQVTFFPSFEAMLKVPLHPDTEMVLADAEAMQRLKDIEQ